MSLRFLDIRLANHGLLVMNINKFLFLLAITLISQSIFATEESAKFGSLRSELNVPFRYVYNLEKDRFGRLWIASEEGLFYISGENVNTVNTDIDTGSSNWLYLSKSLNSDEIVASSINGITSISTLDLSSKEIIYSKDKLGIMLSNVFIHNKSDIVVSSHLGVYAHNTLDGKTLHIDLNQPSSLQLTVDSKLAEQIIRIEDRGIYLVFNYGIVRLDDTSYRPSKVYHFKPGQLLSSCSAISKNLLCVSIIDGKKEIVAIDTLTNELAEMDSLNAVLNSQDINPFHIVSNGGYLYIVDGKKNKSHLYVYDTETNSISYMTKLPTDVVTKMKVIDDTLYVFSEDGVMYRFMISDFIYGFYKKDVGYFIDHLTNGKSTFVATANGVFRSDGSVLEPILGTTGKLATSIALSSDKKLLYYAIENVIFTYDIENQIVIDESVNPKLLSSEDTSQFQLYQSNQILNITPTPYGDIFYESYNDGLWLLSKDGNHKYHSSNEALNHVRYTNSLGYVNDKLAIVRLSDSFALVGRNKSDSLLMSKDNGFKKRLSHKYTYKLGEEFYAANGDGTFTQFNGNLANIRALSSSLSGGACLAKNETGEFVTVSKNIVYSWKEGVSPKVLRDLSRFLGNSVSLESFKCRLNSNILTLANNNSLFFVDLNLPSPMEQLISAPIINFSLLDGDYKLLESFSKLEKNTLFTDNLAAKFLSIEYGSVNQEVSLSFKVNNSDLIRTSGVINVPIINGDNSYLISGFIGTDKLFDQDIRIVKSYTVGSILREYFLSLLLIFVFLIVSIFVWFKSIKSETVLRNKLRFLQYFLDSCLSRMERSTLETQASIKGALAKHLISNKLSGELGESIGDLRQDIEYMKNISDEKQSVLLPESISLADVLETVGNSFNFLNTNIALLERTSTWLNIDKLALSYLIQNYGDTQDSASVKLEGDSVEIKLKINVSDRKIIKAFIERIRNARTRCFLTNSTLTLICKIERSNNVSSLKCDKPFVRTSESKLNIVFIGETVEFDTELKRERLQDLMKSNLKNCRCVFLTTSKSLIDFYNEYSISYLFYVNIYSNQTTFINRAINERVKEINVLCNESVQISLTGIKSVNPISIDLADKILVKIFQRENVSLSNRKLNSMEKLEKKIDDYISNQKDIGPDLAKPFPTGFNAFMKLQGFSLSSNEIIEIQETVGEPINDYCKRLRGRLLAGYIRENPNCLISSAKIYHGFGEKSRTIVIFKEEFGVTPEQYKKSLRKNMAAV